MPGSIQSIERAAAILRTLATGSGALRLSEISAAVHLSKGTAHGILRTLVEVGFVEQDRDTGRYHLGDGWVNCVRTAGQQRVTSPQHELGRPAGLPLR